MVVGRGRVIADTSLAELLARHGGRLEQAYLELTRDAVEYRAEGV